jgi:DNA-binding CsgD family transcriptional regulator
MSFAIETPTAHAAEVAAGCVQPSPSPRHTSPESDWRHFARLEDTLAVALAPLDYPDPASWIQALGDTLLALGNATSGAILLPGAVTRWRSIGAAARIGGAEDQSHDESTERLGAPGQTGPGDPICWIRDDLVRGAGPNPVAGTTRPRHSLGIRVRAASGAVAALYVRRDPRIGGFEHHVIAAFRAVAPAFLAGVNAWLSANGCRMNVEGMLDSLGDAALLFDIDGTAVHTNPAAARLGDELPRLRDEAQRIAWALGAVARRRAAGTARATATNRSGDVAVRSVHVGAVVYRLRGSIVGESLLGARPAVLVTVTTLAAEPLSDDALRTEYGLTTREIEVARLVAAGLSNNEIAERLGVRFFTARNHVERTLAKLGVTSRHRVGPLLRNEVEETDSSRAA